MTLKSMSRTLLAGVVLSMAAPACAVHPPSNVEEASRPMREQDAEIFFRQWLAMIDAKAPLDDYLKYLPDGEFEQWSYTNAEIKNVEELRAYFEANWGAIKQNTNTVRTLKTNQLESGRIEIIAYVDWTAITAEDQTISMPLTYTLTVGPGASSDDPDGVHPKIYRYAIRRSES